MNLINAILWHMASSHVASSHVASSHMASSHVASSHVASSHMASSHVAHTDAKQCMKLSGFMVRQQNVGHISSDCIICGRQIDYMTTNVT